MPGQTDWRSCHKCQGLHFATAASGPGACPAGGSHGDESSWKYIVYFTYSPNPGAAAEQPGWASCTKCRCLFFRSLGGACAGGGQHDPAGSYYYNAILSGNHNTNNTQPGWRSCPKCNCLFFGGYMAASHCSAGGTHSDAHSFEYLVDYSPASQPPPPPTANQPITLNVENRSNGYFAIASVYWQVWKIGIAQPPSGTGLIGETATIAPSAGNGLYDVHADVSVIRVANGQSELADFFGNTQHIHQFQYSGPAISKHFRLVAEGDGSGLYNPVVYSND